MSGPFFPTKAWDLELCQPPVAPLSEYNQITEILGAPMLVHARIQLITLALRLAGCIGGPGPAPAQHLRAAHGWHAAATGSLGPLPTPAC